MSVTVEMIPGIIEEAKAEEATKDAPVSENKTNNVEDAPTNDAKANDEGKSE